MRTWAMDEASAIRERLAWADYAAPRWNLGSDRERAMHNLLKSKVHSAFDRLLVDAKRAGTELDFSHARLQLLAVTSLQSPCRYCDELFGVDDFGVVCDVPPDGRHGQPASRGLANRRVVCARCASAKGPLSGSEFRDVLAALRAADAVAASAVLEALARGYQELQRSRRSKVLPPPPAAASNARGGVYR